MAPASTELLTFADGRVVLKSVAVDGFSSTHRHGFVGSATKLRHSRYRYDCVESNLAPALTSRGTV
jgi:hypothetical protein